MATRSVGMSLEKLASRGGASMAPTESGTKASARAAEAIKRNHRGVVEALLREAHQIVVARGDDLAGWKAAWAAGQRPVGYRQRALYTFFILEELAARPAVEREQRRQESVLALGLVTQLSVDRDDQAYLERAGAEQILGEMKT